MERGETEHLRSSLFKSIQVGEHLSRVRKLLHRREEFAHIRMEAGKGRERECKSSEELTSRILVLTWPESRDGDHNRTMDRLFPPVPRVVCKFVDVQNGTKIVLSLSLSSVASRCILITTITAATKRAWEVKQEAFGWSEALSSRFFFRRGKRVLS